MAEKINREVKPFIISRTFDTNRELMWRMWTLSDHLKQWFGPKGARSKYCKTDLRVGGTTLYNLITPEGQEIWGKQVFSEIEKPERLVFMNSFSDKNGGVTRHPQSPSWPLEILTTVSFTEYNGKTTVIVEWIPINANAEEIKTFDSSRDEMNKGWSGSFDQLEDYLMELEDQATYTSSFY